jgi:hypothetical protein
MSINKRNCCTRTHILFVKISLKCKFSLKGLSYEIDFENVDENGQILV